ncbi:ABC transporter ATP-binding protein [Mesorhizobium microcysteis]|uniref:ABC transporter ATP-binding protein n=1 Tax=Neoaquamicrobium microcysteis TaxID=2682781 RepID=A0A5D4GSJ9_9HYPH|nr:ABC transporter ATP-binding protein [Mesorhizobium microcysteis]TYR31821.1 ABC transporter ATP-binding protein [Mesorhizobium microcysteis]
MSGIEVADLCKRWGAVAAVDNVNFEVKPGTLTVLLGPSGCGKSTTLRLIAGLDSASAGAIRIGGRDVTHAPPAQRGISMVFQSYALFPHLTVEENIIFGLRVRRVSVDERNRRLKKASELLGLGALLQRKPSQLSGGQQQRVALGRAIVAEAPVCLMDEPLSNLDAQLRHDMRKEIRSIQQRLGMTMVYVTHDQIEAMSIADQVVLMRGGVVEQKAMPPELYSRPATTFAARFIGTPPMNLVALSNGTGGAVVRGTDGPPLIEGPGDGLLLGLRPEELRVGASGTLAAEILAVEYHGADSILECRVGDQTLMVRVDGVLRNQIGEKVWLSWADGAAHVFDEKSSRRVDHRPIALGARSEDNRVLHSVS